MNIQEIVKNCLPAGASVKIEGKTALFEVKEENLESVCETLYYEHKLPLHIITAADERQNEGAFKIFYVFGVPRENISIIPFIKLKNKTDFPSLVSKIHEASLYEREIKTFFGLNPTGHPNPRQFNLHNNWPADVFPLRKDFNWNTRPKTADTPYKFNSVEGEGIYEIPVGPVHAGIIEPGHFRFSVAGEEILLLDARLGYTHKGSEKLFETFPMNDKIRLSERISGDSSFNHSLAFCQALEDLAGIDAPSRAKYLRVIFAELERIANHLNDIGFIMLDTGFNFGGSQCTRLREMTMQWNENLTGSRFLRAVNIVGGVVKDINNETKDELLGFIKNLLKDFDEIMEIAGGSSILQNRLKETGVLDRQIAQDHGARGIVVRSCGIAFDSRREFPYAAYGEVQTPVAIYSGGDVYSRFMVRIKELRCSVQIIEEALIKLPQGDISADFSGKFKKNSCAIGIAEGWRGDIVYFVITDSGGNISRVAVRDPSMLNWSTVPYTAKGNVVLDFPLINKSFNLSYSGNDK